jgi:protein involved in sex pheromone biosynthesis
VVFLALTLALHYDIDVYAEVMEKISRNIAKRPAYFFQEGDYAVQNHIAVTIWKDIRGNEDFYAER